MKRSSVWKLVGLAGIAGVAATGVVMARSERKRRDLEPGEVRSRLHERVASIGSDLANPPDQEAMPVAPRRRGVWSRMRSAVQHRRSRRGS